jgi:hypothetical protein
MAQPAAAQLKINAKWQGKPGYSPDSRQDRRNRRVPGYRFAVPTNRSDRFLDDPEQAVIERLARSRLDQFEPLMYSPALVHERAVVTVGVVAAAAEEGMGGP